jgi:hypothetical protein
MENPNLENIPEMPEKFPSVMRDFLSDLSTTFPEYANLWECWLQSNSNMIDLYNYCLTVYPERFFDILYQNDEIFDSSSKINTMFLPSVEFKMLFSISDISENTKKTMWKYLQLILITIMSSIKSTSSFGDAASIFEGIDENELQSKLSETIHGLSDFFKGVSESDDSSNCEMPNGEQFAEDFAKQFADVAPEMEKAFEEMFNSIPSDMDQDQDQEKEDEQNSESKSSENFGFEMPNVDELHSHIKGLFDGKIGSLAKELAEELSGDVMNMFDDGTGDVKSTGDILKKMMKNPKQIMDLIKKISGKLDSKMKSGNISQEELMKEAGDLMSKMKGMGKGNDFQDMMKNMMKNMGPLMGGMGKGAKMDTTKLSNMLSKNSHKERMLKKLEQRKTQAQAQAQANFVLEQSNTPNELIFKGEEIQEKSSAKPPVNDDWLNEPVEKTPAKTNSKPKSKKGKKGK